MRSSTAVSGPAVLAFILAGCGGGSGSSPTSGTGSGSGLGSGNANLSWQAPTSNTNGTALTDLAGFRIYYGTNSSSLTRVIDVSNPGAVSYVVTNLAAGTWYFAITAYTNTGQESAKSNVGSKTIS